MKYRPLFSIKIALPVMLAALLVSCSGRPAVCRCDRSAVAFNDSILSAPETMPGLTGLARRHGQQLLQKNASESYRLSMSHAFGGRYFQVYTLSETGDGCELRVQEFRSAKHPQKGFRLISGYTVPLGTDEWGTFKHLVDTTCFWTMRITDPGEQHYVPDGGSMYLEGHQPGADNCSGRAYHIVYRHYRHPLDASAFNRIVNWLKAHAQEEKLHVYRD